MLSMEALLMLLTLSPLASAQANDLAKTDLLEPLFACLQQTEAQPRYLCLEKETRALSSSYRVGDTVLMDKKEAWVLKQTSEQVRSKDARTRAFDAINAALPITSVITAASQRNGLWRFDIDGYGSWIQAETGELGRDPKAGDQARIRRGAVGGYLLNIRTGPAIRIRPLTG